MYELVAIQWLDIVSKWIWNIHLTFKSLYLCGCEKKLPKSESNFADILWTHWDGVQHSMLLLSPLEGAPALWVLQLEEVSTFICPSVSVCLLSGSVLQKNTVKGQCLFVLPSTDTHTHAHAFYKKAHIIQTWGWTHTGILKHIAILLHCQNTLRWQQRMGFKEQGSCCHCSLKKNISIEKIIILLTLM